MLPSREEIVKKVQETIERKNWDNQAVKVMLRSSEAVLARVQQGISSQLQEDTSSIISDFTTNLSSNLLNATTAFLEKNQENVDLPVFPIGTRYIKQDGSVLYVVIEQPPQTRTLFFTNIAANHFDKTVGLQKQGSYHLSVPYTIFVLKFINGSFSGHLNVFWRSKPLSKVGDSVFPMPLPNISDGQVCLGEFKPHTEGKKIDEQCNHIVSGFWQTVFSHDYIVNFTNFMGSQNITIHDWVNGTKTNPLYAAKKFKLPEGLNLYEFLKSEALSNGQNNLIAVLKTHILEAVGEIGEEIKNLLVDLDVKGENREKVHVDTMSKVIREIVVQAYSELWEHLSVKLEKERAADAAKNRSIKEAMKAEFMEWVRNTYPQLQK